MKPRPPIRIRLLRTLLLTAAVLALMGVPYWIWTPGSDYHHPNVENLRHGLAGIHAGLERAGTPANFQGAALYSHWEMDDAEWQTWRERFLKTAP